MALALDLEYRVTLDGKPFSSPFELEASPGQRVEMDLTTSSQQGSTNATAVAAIGGGAMVAGVLIVITEFVQVFGCNGDSSQPIPCPADGRVAAAGLGILLEGAAALTTGLILRHRYTQTHQSQTVSDLLRVPPSSDTAWMRAPVWRDSVARPAMPGEIPLLSRSF
jgi:hypothetical protein